MSRESPEVARERTRQWRIKNRERALATVRAYRAEHREESRARTRAWQLANPEKVRQHSRDRHRRVKEAPINDLTDEQWMAILYAFRFRCAYCGIGGVKMGQDHVVPLALGGAHTASNVVPACPPCNQRKWLNSAPAQLALAI
jgi:5-methylcytosine-specific restriction endonuclease McrA